MEKEQIKELVKQANANMRITDAYEWEGSSIYRIAEFDDKTILLSIFGRSTVEHEGDEEGIKSQASEIIHDTAIVTMDNVKYLLTIDSATCTITNDKPRTDEDYEILVTGNEKLKYELK